MLKLTLILVLCFYLYEVQGYGYRYNFNIGTGETNLWTFLPGQDQPVVYAYEPGREWPQIYKVPYEGLVPNQAILNSIHYNADPALYKYRGPDGKYKYKCKPEAYYSELRGKCLWKPGHLFRRRLQQQQKQSGGGYNE